MDDIKALQQQLAVADFPKETADAIKNVLGMAQARNSELNDQEIDEILNLVDDAINKNKLETKQLLDLAEAISDAQEAVLDAVEEEEEIKQLEENQTGETPPPTTAPAASA